MKKSLTYAMAVILLPVLLLSACSVPSFSLKSFTSGDTAAATVAPAEADAKQVQQTSSTVASSTEAQAAEAAPVTSAVLAALQGDLARIYESVNPSVVNIQVTVESTSITGDLPQLPGFPSLPDEMPSQSALGSGFVWDEEGHIVTNNHVVENATSILVKFWDDTLVPAEVVGTDPAADLAVIQVDVSSDVLRPVAVADSTTLKVGQLAVAIGNPYGYEGTMTVGFISAIGRSLPVSSSSTLETASGGSYTIPDIIQTDAAVNPGNSGGVLVNDEGEVIGIPTAIESASGSNSGIGFAVPSSIVLKEVPVLIEEGKYEHSWLGISGTTLSSDLAQAMGLDAGQRGILVATVTSGGPADDAGLQGSTDEVEVSGQQTAVGGDVIVAVDGRALKQFDDLVSYLAVSTVVGQRVTLTILRDGKEMSVDVTLGARSDSTRQSRAAATPLPSAAGAWLGIEGMDLSPAISTAMGLSEDQAGVLVVSVVADSPAEQAGLRESTDSVDIDGQQAMIGGDIIIAAGQDEIATMVDLRSFLAEAQPGQEVTLTVLRNGRERRVDVTLGERPTSDQ